MVLGQCSITKDVFELCKKGPCLLPAQPFLKPDLDIGGTAPNAGEGQSEGWTKTVICILNVATVDPCIFALSCKNEAGFLFFGIFEAFKKVPFWGFLPSSPSFLHPFFADERGTLHDRPQMTQPPYPENYSLISAQWEEVAMCCTSLFSVNRL